MGFRVEGSLGITVPYYKGQVGNNGSYSGIVSAKEFRASLGFRLPRGPIVVPFGGSYIEFYKVIPKRNDFGAYG